MANPQFANLAQMTEQLNATMAALIQELKRQLLPLPTERTDNQLKNPANPKSDRKVFICGYNQDEDCLCVATDDICSEYYDNSVCNDIVFANDDEGNSTVDMQGVQSFIDLSQSSVTKDEQQVFDKSPELDADREVEDHENLLAKIEDPSSTVTQVCAESIHDKVISVSHSDFSSPIWSTNTALETFCANKNEIIVANKVFDKSPERNEYSAELKPKPPDAYDSLNDLSMYGFNAENENRIVDYVDSQLEIDERMIQIFRLDNFVLVQSGNDVIGIGLGATNSCVSTTNYSVGEIFDTYKKEFLSFLTRTTLLVKDSLQIKRGRNIANKVFNIMSERDGYVPILNPKPPDEGPGTQFSKLVQTVSVQEFNQVTAELLNFRGSGTPCPESSTSFAITDETNVAKRVLLSSTMDDSIANRISDPPLRTGSVFSSSVPTHFPTFHASGLGPWHAVISYDACVRLCLHSWARECREAPIFLGNASQLLRNAFGLQQVLLQSEKELLRNRSMELVSEGAALKLKKVFGKIKVKMDLDPPIGCSFSSLKSPMIKLGFGLSNVKSTLSSEWEAIRKVCQSPQIPAHDLTCVCQSLAYVYAGTRYLKVCVLWKTGLSTAHNNSSSYEAVRETYSCSLRLQSLSVEDAVGTQPGSGETHVFLPDGLGDDLVNKVFDSKGRHYERVVAQVADMTNDPGDKLHWWPMYHEPEHEMVGRIQLYINYSTTLAENNNVKCCSVAETVAYNMVLEDALNAQHFCQRNLLLLGSWRWLLTEFAFYGVLDAYTKLRYLSYAMDVATPTADCLNLVRDLLSPVIKKDNIKCRMSHQENRILGELVYDQIEQAIALVFENHKSLDESSPSGMMDIFGPATNVTAPALGPAYATLLMEGFPLNLLSTKSLQVNISDSDMKTLRLLVVVINKYQNSEGKMKDYYRKLLSETLGIISVMNHLYESDEMEIVIIRLKNLFISEPAVSDTGLFQYKPNLDGFLTGLGHFEAILLVEKAILFWHSVGVNKAIEACFEVLNIMAALIRIGTVVNENHFGAAETNRVISQHLIGFNGAPSIVENDIDIQLVFAYLPP